MNKLAGPAAKGLIDFGALEQVAMPKLAGESPGGIIGTAIPYIMFFAGGILLVVAIISGFNMMTSGGDPQKAKAAQSRLTNALVGFLVILFAYWIVRLFAVLFSIRQIGEIFQ